MSYIHPAWVEHQRRRWLRHDAHRFAPPDPNAYRSYATRRIERRAAEEQEAVEAERKAFEADLLDIRRELAEVKFELAWRQLCCKYGYDPSQPRRPKGDPDGGGRWVDTGASEGRVRLAASDEIITDAFGQPYYQPGGHHEFPEQVWGKWKLSPETRKIFKDATTGTAPATMRRTPDGVREGNLWNYTHRAYNSAAEELGNQFLEKNGLKEGNALKTEQMTPDQARSLLKEVRESPTLRSLNDTMRLIRRLFRLRTGGRGSE